MVWNMKWKKSEANRVREAARNPPSTNLDGLLESSINLAFMEEQDDGGPDKRQMTDQLVFAKQLSKQSDNKKKKP